MRLNLLLTVALLAGCSAFAGSEKEWPQPAGLTASAAEAPDEREGPDHSGRYEGSYVCPQGKTGLLLLIEHLPEGKLEAVFEFGPHADNPDVPIGSFRMRGWVDEAGVMELEASEEDWLQRPEGYVTVDLRGAFEGERVTGEIVNVECSTFSAQRRVD